MMYMEINQNIDMARLPVIRWKPSMNTVIEVEAPASHLSGRRSAGYSQQLFVTGMLLFVERFRMDSGS